MKPLQPSLVLAVALVAVLAGCGSSHHASKNTLIVVNKRIGPFHFGQPRAKVEAIVGKGHVYASRSPSADANHIGTLAEDYPAASLRVIYLTHDGKAAVFGVETTSPDYRTKSGVGVGSTVEEVKRLGASCSGDACELRDPDADSGAVTFFRLDKSGARVTSVGLGAEFG